MSIRIGKWSSALACALISTGCLLAAGDAPTDRVVLVEGPPGVVPSGYGLLTVNWSIDGDKTTRSCDDLDADKLELVVYDRDGERTRVTAPCEAFAVTVELREGDYTADATLIAEDGKAQTTTLPLRNIEIASGTELRVDTDFPRRSSL